MPQDVALGLVALLMIIAYIWGNFWLAALINAPRVLIADRMDDLFRPRNRALHIDEDTGLEIEPDDVVVQLEWKQNTWDTPDLRPVTRGEMRGRMWMFLFGMPLVGYLNYRFIDQVIRGFELVFGFLGQIVLDLFYGGG